MRRVIFVAVSVRARRLLLEASAVYHSPISVAELAIKGMLDRLSPVIASLNGADFDAAGLRELPLTARQAEAIAHLPELVRHDPFYRFLAAQALAEGLAIIEIPDVADRQGVDAPAGVEVLWLPRADTQSAPGALALEAVRKWKPSWPRTLQAYLAGEHQLVAESRRHLVSCGVPKERIAFTSYWKVGRAG